LLKAGKVPGLSNGLVTSFPWRIKLRALVYWSHARIQIENGDRIDVSNTSTLNMSNIPAIEA
jgi:hypothetical protein